MKISELIRKLTEIKSCTGDLTVTLEHWDTEDVIDQSGHVLVAEHVKIRGADRSYDEGVFCLTEHPDSKSMEVVVIKGETLNNG